MANPNGRKGASFERVIADYLRDSWHDMIDRRVKTGAKDKGDIANFRVGNNRRLVIECKNVKAMNLSGWVTEAQEEAFNDEAVAGVVVHKRRGRAEGGDQFVTMTLSSFLLILRAAEGTL